MLMCVCVLLLARLVFVYVFVQCLLAVAGSSLLLLLWHNLWCLLSPICCYYFYCCCCSVKRSINCRFPLRSNSPLGLFVTVIVHIYWLIVLCWSGNCWIVRHYDAFQISLQISKHTHNIIQSLLTWITKHIWIQLLTCVYFISSHWRTKQRVL